MPKAKVPTLTPKQEKFCLEYLKTGNASEAYRQTYNTERMKPESINRLAVQLLRNVKIGSRLEALRAPEVKKAQITLGSHLARLSLLRKKAEKLGQMSAAISAEVARGKAAGLYVEKVEHSGGTTVQVTVSPEQVKTVLEQIRGEF